MPQINLKRQSGVIGTSTAERIMEGMLKMSVFRQPEGQPEQDLAGDAFHFMYKAAPKVLDDVPPERSVNQAVMKWFADSNPDRSRTTGSITTALAAAGVTWAGLTQDSTVKEALEKQRQADEAAQEAKQAEQEAADMARQAAQQPGGLTPEQQQAIQNAVGKAQAARAKADAAGQAAQQVIEDAKDHPLKKYAMSKVAKSAKEEAEKVSDVMQAWGIGDGDLTPMDSQQVIEMARSRNVAELTKMFGRFRGMARQTIANVKNGKAGGVPEVDETRDFSRMFQTEAAQLSPRMPFPIRLAAIQRYVGRGLMGFVPQEEGSKSGSCLFYVDESGSIGDDLCAMEKALVIAMGHAAQDEVEERRPWECYGFNSRVLDGINDKDDWRKVIGWASSYHSGGTRINEVLKHAIERLKTFKLSDISDCDVCIITDGQDYIDDEILAEFDSVCAEFGTRLAYIHLGWGDNEKLSSRAKVYIHVDDVSDFGKMVDSILIQVATMIADA